MNFRQTDLDSFYRGIKSHYIQEITLSKFYGRLVKRQSRFFVLKWVLLTCVTSAVSAYFSIYSRDVTQYQSLFACINNAPSCNLFFWDRVEVGFKFILHSISWIFGFSDFREFWFALAAISFGLKIFVFEKNLRRPNIGLVLYLIGFFPLLEMTQIRLAVALSFWLLSLHFAARREHLQTWMFLIISLLVHNQIGLLVFPQLIYLIFRRNLSALFCLFLGAVFAALVQIMLSGFGVENLNPLLKLYLLEKRSSSVQSAILSCIIISYPLLVVFYGRQINDFSRQCLQSFIFIIPAIIVFFDIPVFFYRLSDVAVLFILICSVNFAPRPKLQIISASFLGIVLFLSLIRFMYFLYFQPLFSGPPIAFIPW